MTQMIAVMIYGCAMALALSVLVRGLSEHRVEIARALFGDAAVTAPRVRLVARARRGVPLSRPRLKEMASM